MPPMESTAKPEDQVAAGSQQQAKSVIKSLDLGCWLWHLVGSFC
jgi:hypothetical protein